MCLPCKNEPTQPDFSRPFPTKGLIRLQQGQYEMNLEHRVVLENKKAFKK